MKALSIRPEIRGDFADKPVFGNVANPVNKSQLTLAMDVLFKF